MVGAAAAAAHFLPCSPPKINCTTVRRQSLLASGTSDGTTTAAAASRTRTTSSFSRPMASLFMKPVVDASFIDFRVRQRSKKLVVISAASSSSNAADGGSWVPADNKKQAVSSSAVSDIVWPSLGAFGAMAVLGKIDQLVLASRGMTSMSIAPLGAVCAVLFLTPSAPAAQKYNMFMAQIGCAAIGVFIYSLLGPGWLARSVSLSLSIAFMAVTRCNHPPAAGLPLLYIDGAKFHHLSYWFAVFPAAGACVILAIIQEMVCFLKENVKF